MYHAWTLKRALAWFFAALLVGTILGYAYIQARGVIGGPVITLATPANGMTSTSSLIAIVGRVTHAKSFTLDGRMVFVDTEGRFYEDLLLSPGYNIIELTANDGEGRETRKALEIMYSGTSTDMFPRSLATSTATSTGN